VTRVRTDTAHQPSSAPPPATLSDEFTHRRTGRNHHRTDRDATCDELKHPTGHITGTAAGGADAEPAAGTPPPQPARASAPEP